MWQFSFTYEGHTYSNPDDGSPIMMGYDEIIGIEIRKPDVLGGVVRYIWTTNCAYLNPDGLGLMFNDNSCTFINPGTSIDPAKVFFFSAGSKNYTVGDCETKKDLINNVNYTTCRASGSFSLVLVNNLGVTKTISGTFANATLTN